MLDDLRYRLRAIFRRRAIERELDDELRFHLEQQAAMESRAGLPPDEARRQARMAFGGVDVVKEASRDARGVRILEVAARDLRYAVRTLRRSPVFATVAIVSLTLGIGANAAMFQLLNALVLRPLPIANPQELAEVHLPDEDLEKARGNQYRYPAMTNPQWEALRTRQQAFSGVFAWADDEFNLASAGEVRLTPGLWVSGELFPVLGLTPAAGRLFTPADDRRGCGLPGAVVSYDYWQRELQGDPRAIGSTISVNARQMDIIGVAPRGFTGLQVGQAFDVALPICARDTVFPGTSILDSGTNWWLTVMGRLRPGWTVERAHAHVRTLGPELFKATLPKDYPAVSVTHYLASKLDAVPASTGRSWLREEYATPLLLLLAMTGFVLLIACANLTNLLLARGTVRARELSLRLALGASRGRLVSQLLCESLVIVAVSAVAGLAVAQGVSAALVRLIGASRRPIVLALDPDWRVAGFMLGTAALTCLLLGLVPALRATRRAPGEALKAGTRNTTADPGGLAIRRALVVAQVAVSLVLVVGALLFARSFRNLLSEPLGFEPRNVLVVDAGLPPTAGTPEAAAALKRDLPAALRAIPGVRAVGETNIIPLSGTSSGNTVWRDGSTRDRGIAANLSRVSAGYFETIGMRLLGGRDIRDADDAAAPKVAVVNETFAKQFAPGRSPVGLRFWIEATPSSPETLYEIVGLVSDAKYRRLQEDPRPVIFMALAQYEPAGRGGTWLVRSTLDGQTLAPAVRDTLQRLDPRLRFVLRPLTGDIDETLRRDRAMALLSSLFGLLAAMLAAVGLHGVVAYGVERRRREIGIRLALGASRGTIASSVVRESGWLVAAGLAAGLVLSLVLTGAVRGLLFGIAPNDAATVASAVAGFAVVALAASLIPARRAARVDPMSTLRDD
jgi:predicted permease